MSMTQDAACDKTPDRNTFLRALFAGATDHLYLELRCIHPDGQPPRTFWSKVGDKLNLVNAFNRAKQANADGYGVYFAPCLRREKVGKAESAALLPALWVDIDCDGDANRYNTAFDKLNSFELKPSAVVDSGGGLHAYWFLAEPFPLEDDSARDKAASILRGLSEALGGDNQYVKSVASVMRLPGSINTKPDRSSATVSVLELHPDRRYTIEQFTWLESKPLKVERISGLNVVTLNNGQHPLPERTEAYLAAGASEGNRNHELFAAACQLRDAGHSQAEAERQLVPRHVASGSTEREAVATIKSAYSRPPREPIRSPREQVATLVGNIVGRPTTAQIVDAVKACATLDPIEWAEERQKLKAVCDDGLKLSDLDRLYRDAKKQTERAERASFHETEGYAEVDGKLIYRRQTAHGSLEKAVADWSGQVIERVSRVDDEGQIEHIAVVQLRRDGMQICVEAPSEVFGDDAALRRLIAGRAGERFTVRAGMGKHLAPAILSLSEVYPSRTSYRFMGWTQIDGRWAYIAPTENVKADKTLSVRHEVELESRLRDYRLTQTAWEGSQAAFQAMMTVFPPELAPTLIAFALLPLFQRFFPAAAPKPALHLVGTTGSGKSEVASLMASLYGQFSRDTPPAQWGDTVNTVELLGYALADALYWVDDFKHIYADERTFTRFLQSYSRGMGRGRLTREAKIRQERPCRGHILSTGETTMAGEASILARMIVLEMPPWESRDPGGVALAQADQLRGHLSGFTAHLATWLAAQADLGTLTRDIRARFEAGVNHYRALLNTSGAKANNTGRVIGNWAVLKTVYGLVDCFLAEEGAPMLPVWSDLAVESAQAMREERAGQLYLDIILQLAASGRAVICDMEQMHEVSPHTPILGYKQDGFVYLLPDIAYREVCRIHEVNFTLQAIGSQLKEDKLLIPGTTNLSIQKRLNGQRVRVWQFPVEVFE